MSLRLRARNPTLVLVALAVLLAALSGPAAAAEAVLFRIFLRDGSTLVSYGDYARVAGRVVFSMPIGGVEGDSPRLELVSIDEGTIDWERTEQYAQAARARRYAETRGEADFSRLSSEVALALNQIALTEDPAGRVAIAERARRMLAEWPSRNYHYRAHDVSQLSGLLDEVISELRVAAGMDRFDLSFIATTSPQPPVSIMAPPTLRESIEQALTASRLTPEPTERVALLEAVVRSLGDSGGEGWTAALHARAAAELRAERRTERAYADLAARMIAAADERLRRADVRGLQSLVRSVLENDDELGRRRPQAIAALLATLDARLNEARRFRLVRDAWTARQGALRAYTRKIRPVVEEFRRSTEGLKDIRQLAGPAPESLARLATAVGEANETLARVSPAPELKTVHGMFVSALRMAGLAVSIRQSAVRSADMDVAWQASSAAAGALMMFERATEELQRLAAPPRL